MRSQGAGISKQKHILELDFSKIHGTKYVDTLIEQDIPKLTSPESALLLSESYDDTYITNKVTSGPDYMAEYLFGVMKYREQEDPTDFTQYGSLVDEYLGLNIKKFFGLTITEYLDLPFSSRDILLVKAREAMENLNKEMDNINQDIKNKNKQPSLNNSLEDSLFGD